MGAGASARPAVSSPTSVLQQTTRNITCGDLAELTRVVTRHPSALGYEKLWSSAAAAPSSEPLKLLFSLATHFREGGQGLNAETSIPSLSTITSYRDLRGRTPLHTAASTGCINNLRILLTKGADPWLLDHSGLSPLHLACAAGHAHVTVALCSWAASHHRPANQQRPYIDQPSGLGAQLTPLHVACARRQADVVEVLLRNGASLSVRGHCVCPGRRKPHPALAAYDIPPAAGTYASPLHVASARPDNVPVIKLLVSCYLENVLVRAQCPIHDPRLQKTAEGMRPVDLALATAVAAATTAATSSTPPAVTTFTMIASGSSSTSHLSQQQQPRRTQEISLAALLDPNRPLPDLLPEVARAATSIRSHRTLAGGAVPTLQMLAASVLGARLAASAAAVVEAAGRTAVMGSSGNGRPAAAAAVLGSSSNGRPAAAAVVTGGSGSCCAVVSPAAEGTAGGGVAKPLVRSNSARSCSGGSGGDSRVSSCGTSPSGCSSACSSNRTSSSGAVLSRASSRVGASSRGEGEVAQEDELCGICMSEPTAMRNDNCSHGVCTVCAQQLCKQIPGKLTPLVCPFCRTVVSRFVGLGC